MYAELNKALVNTRDSLRDACYPLGINSADVDLELLSISQCDDCSIWLPKKQIVDGTCGFCRDMDDLRF